VCLGVCVCLRGFACLCVCVLGGMGSLRNKRHEEVPVSVPRP